MFACLCVPLQLVGIISDPCRFSCDRAGTHTNTHSTDSVRFPHFGTRTAVKSPLQPHQMTEATISWFRLITIYSFESLDRFKVDLIKLWLFVSKSFAMGGCLRSEESYLGQDFRRLDYSWSEKVLMYRVNHEQIIILSNWNLGECFYLVSDQELDEQIDSTLISVWFETVTLALASSLT